MATKSELIRRRNALYDLERACSSMESAGIPCDALKLALEDLQSEVVTILVPCLICGQSLIVPVLVGSYTMPEAAVCAVCDHEATGGDTEVLVVTDEPVAPQQ